MTSPWQNVIIVVADAMNLSLQTPETIPTEGTKTKDILPSKHHHIAVFKISVGQWTLTGKIWVNLASFPSLSYVNFGKIVLQSSKFHILFRRLILTTFHHWLHQRLSHWQLPMQPRMTKMIMIWHVMSKNHEIKRIFINQNIKTNFS